MATKQLDSYIFEFAPGGLCIPDKEKEQRPTPRDFGPIGSNRKSSRNKLRSQLRCSEEPSSDGLIPSLVSDFINDDGSLVVGRDLRGMVPMYPGREPPIPPKVARKFELDTVLHPQVIPFWNWLEPASSAKVPVFQVETFLTQEQKKEMLAAVKLATDPWISSRLRKSSLNSSTLSLSANSTVSSGYGSGYNSELQSPESDYKVCSNMPLKMSSVTGNTFFNRMAELCKPSRSTFSDCKVGPLEVPKENQINNIEKDSSEEKIVHSKRRGAIAKPVKSNEKFVETPKAAWISNDKPSCLSQLTDVNGAAGSMLLTELKKLLPRKDWTMSHSVGAQLEDFSMRYGARGDKLRPRHRTIPDPDFPNDYQTNNQATGFSPKPFVFHSSIGPIHQPTMSTENFDTFACQNDAESCAWKLSNDYLGSDAELTLPWRETATSEIFEAGNVEKYGTADLRWPEIAAFPKHSKILNNYQYSRQAAMTSLENSRTNKSQECTLKSKKPYESSDDLCAAAEVESNSFDPQVPARQSSYNPNPPIYSLNNTLTCLLPWKTAPTAKDYKDQTQSFINKYGIATTNIRQQNFMPSGYSKYFVKFNVSR